jgi:hypothetical protein
VYLLVADLEQGPASERSDVLAGLGARIPCLHFMDLKLTEGTFAGSRPARISAWWRTDQSYPREGHQIPAASFDPSYRPLSYQSATSFSGAGENRAG